MTDRPSRAAWMAVATAPDVEPYTTTSTPGDILNVATCPTILLPKTAEKECQATLLHGRAFIRKVTLKPDPDSHGAHQESQCLVPFTAEANFDPIPHHYAPQTGPGKVWIRLAGRMAKLR